MVANKHRAAALPYGAPALRRAPAGATIIAQSGASLSYRSAASFAVGSMRRGFER
jgi:hypothetical protein